MYFMLDWPIDMVAALQPLRYLHSHHASRQALPTRCQATAIFTGFHQDRPLI